METFDENQYSFSLGILEFALLNKIVPSYSEFQKEK
jgi:hypothetical protein